MTSSTSCPTQTEEEEEEEEEEAGRGRGLSEEEGDVETELIFSAPLSPPHSNSSLPSSSSERRQVTSTFMSPTNQRG